MSVMSLKRKESSNRKHLTPNLDYETQSDVVKTGYLRKLKTAKKKFFVLRTDSSSGPARLEYYDSEKKWRLGASSKRRVYLEACFNINRKMDTRQKFVVALHTKYDCLSVAMDTEEELEAWLTAMLELQQGITIENGQNKPKPAFEHVWQVTVKNKGLGTSKNITGPYRLCLSASILSLVKMTLKDEETEPIVFPLVTIRRCGHSDCFFFMEVGRSAVTGAGELWMQAEENLISQNMHETILNYMKSSRNIENSLPVNRVRSSSTCENSKFSSSWRSSISSEWTSIGTSLADLCDHIVSRTSKPSESCSEVGSVNLDEACSLGSVTSNLSIDAPENHYVCQTFRCSSFPSTEFQDEICEDYLPMDPPTEAKHSLSKPVTQKEDGNVYMNMDRTLEEKCELPKTSPFNLSVAQEGYMEMNQLISSVSLGECSNYLEMEFPVNLKRILADSSSIATQNNEKFHLDKKHSSNPNMKMQCESNPFSAVLRDYEKCRFTKKSQSAPTLVTKIKDKSKTSEKRSFNKNLEEIDYSQKLPSINSRLASNEAHVDQIHDNQHVTTATGRPTPLSVLLKLAKKQNSTIPFSLSKFRKSLKAKEIPTLFKGKKSQSAETITKTQTSQTLFKFNGKIADKHTCVSSTQWEPSNDYLNMKPGSHQTSDYTSMSKDGNMNADSTNQELHNGLNYFQNTSDYMTMDRQETLVKDKHLFQPLYVSKCMGFNENKNMSFEMNKSCIIPQKEDDLSDSLKSSKSMSFRLLPLEDNQKLNYRNILPTTKSGFSTFFAQSKSANLYHLSTNGKNGEINQKSNQNPLSETLDNYSVSQQDLPDIQKHPNKLLQVSIPSINSPLEAAEGDYVLLSSKESPNHEKMNFLSSYQYSVIHSSLYNGSLSDCNIGHSPIFGSRNIYDGLKSEKNTYSDGEDIHTLLRKQRSISLDKSLNPTIKTSLHHKKSSYPALSNSSINKSASDLSLGITEANSSIQCPIQNSLTDMPNPIHNLNSTNLERKPQPVKRQVISIEAIKSGDHHLPEDSQPPQQSPGLNLNYALLDLTPTDSDKEKTQSLRSTTFQTPTVQSTQEIPLSYAQIDFTKSEGLRNISHGLRGGKV
ncbi:uncharacterized protein LOC143249549 isoform X2 [Tachypleus tridentatus]|uniref:uncharacterized protein LOC143249549 isoform X2 n=1 Tax=Tachypleus tridentatus TaxID=6853 RepID=UPI003FD2947E